MEVDFKTLADYVPVFVAVIGVANTVVKYALKKGSKDWDGKASEDAQTDLDVISAQLEEILGLLKDVMEEEKKQAELRQYLERCKEEKEGLK